MVCPLRFVLVGVSAAVALVVAFNTSWVSAEPEVSLKQDHHQQQQERDREQVDGRCDRGRGYDDYWWLATTRGYLRLLLDMFTGKYMYDLWNGGTLSGDAAAAQRTTTTASKVKAS
uniref:Uncharacterized protein n=1 Tax=Tetraselmis chuii TaxID=63592 RepID=A0A7S1T4Q9_9CHLO|mmetsp:Transcript_5859/g.10557  ORF Transcript_5859/g.10557 Transcript_5859/m.10557 type:complete len:116 (+) Transcript_5859:518-865(+)|eukprot:CAMPEP_0177774106 /NCGR_PEP_ID=MMETSP0491_2-20121128/13296_1 /TAXON_ID=63592 /ORGANISM="Tetraselmis chuii, Strain PLY429" /LENGTH=115 /DNA_ID=CAMNT_0019292395 /DNA_START=613 /DNA_END=960 /DNA_ORIENTATION=-